MFGALLVLRVKGRDTVQISLHATDNLAFSRMRLRIGDRDVAEQLLGQFLHLLRCHSHFHEGLELLHIFDDDLGSDDFSSLQILNRMTQPRCAFPEVQFHWMLLYRTTNCSLTNMYGAGRDRPSIPGTPSRPGDPDRPLAPAGKGCGDCPPQPPSPAAPPVPGEP